MDPSQRWKEIGSKTLHSSWILHRDGRRLVVKHYIFHGSLTEMEGDWYITFFMDRSQRWKEIGSKTLHFLWIPHRDGRRLVVKHHRVGRRLVVHYIFHGSLTEMEGDW